VNPLDAWFASGANALPFPGPERFFAPRPESGRRIDERTQPQALPSTVAEADNHRAPSTRRSVGRARSWDAEKATVEIVQFEIPGRGRRIGFVDGDVVQDVTAHRPELAYVYDAFQAAVAAHRPLAEFVRSLVPDRTNAVLSRDVLFSGSPGGSGLFVRPPLDHPDPHRVLVTGTGLTHTGSMQSRDQMHAAQKEGHSSSASNIANERSAMPQTDSARMFEMGVQGGKPDVGTRGTSPEWFYKGDGGILRGHRDALEIPAFALDGGEEPEIVGCYVIDAAGRPRRLGFALGNEWSDHATEKINYLYLAPSKLRTCAIGPTLNTHCDFQDVPLRCAVDRQGRTIYDSGELRTGEKWMCHSLRNLEDHHFKYAQHRRPGDIHLHFFGTSRLSHSTRDWKFQAGDEIRIEAPGFCSPLVNHVAAGPRADARPIEVVPA